MIALKDLNSSRALQSRHVEKVGAPIQQEETEGTEKQNSLRFLRLLLFKF